MSPINLLLRDIDMKKYILVLLTLVISSSTLLVAANDLSPTFSIRYEDFINTPEPSAAVGLKLTIDEDRYTGFEVNTNRTNFDSRLIIGWGWGLFGLGVHQPAGVGTDSFAHYTFGVSYPILDNLISNLEYVMTPDEAAAVDDRLRLTLSVGF